MKTTLIGPFLISLVLASQFVFAQGEKAVGNKPADLKINKLPVPSKRWALIVGVSQYEDGNITSLPGANNDARALREALRDYAGFDEKQIILLTTDESRDRQPTKNNILRYLGNLSNTVPKDGLLLVSFSGHGIELQNQAFLLASDTFYNKNLHVLERTALSIQNDLKELIHDTGVSQVVVLLDVRGPASDRSGRDNLWTEAYKNGPSFDTRNEEIQANNNGFSFDTRNQGIEAFATIYSTSIGERAYDNTHEGKGYFTWAFIEGLKGGAANQKDEVTLGALIRYVEGNVSRQVRIDLGMAQRPFSVFEGYKADDLVLGIVKKKIPLSVASTNAARPRRPGDEIVFGPRSVGVTKTNADGSKQDVKLYDGSYALVIGNSEYSMGWSRLGGVKSDVAAVREVLERHGFKVEVEENLTSERFEPRIRRFINDYGYDRDNRLMIYYAGHGHTLNSVGDKRDLGYIVPADTPLPDKDPRGFRQKAVSMYAIQTFARDIQAKHAMFVFDSCFSGKLFALRNKPGITPFIVDKIDHPVRQFITAGNETQTVPDESIFRKAFVRGLEGDADRNDDGYIVGTELAEYLKEAVTNYSNRRQTPQYGTINDIDLDRGDIVFVKFPAVTVIPLKITESIRVPKQATPEFIPNKGDLLFWQEIEKRNTIFAYESYLNEYPNGEFVKVAKLRLGNLKWANFKPIAKKIKAYELLTTERRYRSFKASSIEELMLAVKGTFPYGYFGFIDRLGKEIIPFKYDRAYSFSEDLAVVQIDGKYGFIDKTGKEVIPLIYDYSYDFSEGLAFACLNGKCGYINKFGNETISFEYDDNSGSTFENGIAIVEKNKKFGLIDRSGKAITPFKYSKIDFFEDGLAKVSAEEKVGFVNRNGKEVIPLELAAASSFSEGLAAVRVGNRYGFIDKTGKTVIPFKYDLVKDFSEGLAAVNVGGFGAGKYGFIDKTGKEIIPLKYDSVGDFHEDFASVELNNKSGFINKAGKEVTELKYDSTGWFVGGLAAVHLNAKQGYIDRTGKEVVPLKYDYDSLLDWCSYQRDGFIGIMLNGKKGFVDLYGNEYFDF